MGIALAIIIPVVVILLFLAVSYVKAPPNMAYIITGIKKTPRIVSGRATLRIPFLERIDKVPLDLIQIDIKPDQEIPTTEFINISVNGVANIQITDINKASQLFLGKSIDHIRSVAREVLEGNMREIIGQMKLTELVKNRDAFAEKVSENAKKDMSNMGITIINLLIQDFSDRNDVLTNLGIDNVEQIKKDAAIAKANASRDVAIATANAQKEANDTRVAAELEIAKKNTELEKKKAALKVESDTEKAKADAAYEIQKQIKLKEINEAQVEAEIIRTEKEAQLQEKKIALRENELNASIKKQAEAEKYKLEKEAEAKKFMANQIADAELFKRKNEAEAKKLEADAARHAAEQEAAGIKAKGLAEAEAIEKKAEAMKKMDEAAKMQMVLDSKVLPEVVAAAAKPMEAIDKIVMYGENDSAKLTKNVTTTVKQALDGLKDATGVDPMSLIMGAFGGKLAAEANDRKDNE